MNQTVKNWGCVATNFTNPTGLNNDAQITNTYDAAIIMDKVSSDPTLKLMLQQQAYTLPATAHRGAKALTTTNQLLINGNKNRYAGVSSKMGYTSKAKYAIASEIDYNGQRLIAVVLKANGSQFTDSTKLLNYAKVASLEAAAGGATYNTVLNVSNNVSTQAMAVTNAAAGLVANSATTVAAGSGTNALLVSTGDTAGTWQKDAKGWYFLKANGQSAANEWIKQNGKVYCVDSTGYMITGWRQMSNGEMYYFDPNSGELRHNTWVNVSTGAYYLQADGTLAKADKGTTKNIVTSVGTYTIDENGKALAKVA
jgi:D-alanyl-D-alanine carboxypeptidase